MSVTPAASADIERVADVLTRRTAPVEIVGAVGGFAGLVLAAVRQRMPKRTLVVVTPDAPRAQEIRLGLRFFEPTESHFDAVPTFRLLDHSPMSGMSPSRLRVLDRVATLFRLTHDLDVTAVVVPAAALLDRVIPREVLDEEVYLAVTGDALDRDGLLDFLARTGFHRVPAVEDPGTFAVRGGIVDVFSPLYEQPVRIDLWGDEVDSLRFFDPSTQQTTSRVDEVTLGPARDVVLSAENVRRAKGALLDLADELHVPTSRARAMVDDLESGILAVGIEDLLPAFYPKLDTVFDVVPEDALWLVVEPERCAEAIRTRSEDLARRARAARDTAGQMTFDVGRLFADADHTLARLAHVAAGQLVPFSVLDPTGRDVVSVRFDARDNADVRVAIEEATRSGDDRVLAPLTSQVHRWRDAGLAVVVCSHSEGGIERLRGLLAHYGVKTEVHTSDFHLGRVPELREAEAAVHLFRGDPGHGFRAESLGLVLLDETEILGRKARRRRQRHAQVAPEAAVASWRDLKVGDLVVHLMHGIGRYRGLQKTAVGAIEVDFLQLEYAGGNKLFVPVDKLHLVSRYSASEGHEPKIDKLGGTGWQRTRKRVTKAVRDIADKLLRLYAERELREGHAYPAPGEYYARFEAAFPWEETPDQAKAIDDVLGDLERDRPMDRLVCGDVGFGKTEVAMRAAFLAALEGRQVAVLVPTVVLAEQHRLTFERRFDGFPVEVEALTRTRSAREITDIMGRLKAGRIDIVIGTHRLLSKDVKFRELGLVIIDEEHRFGVSHKELLKRVQPNVDVLTLTATPIPRTLHLSMSGLRDISLIQTPPVDRLSVRTLVAQPTERVISEAIDRELARGGQVFYVHNRVQDIDKHAELLGRLVPKARIAVGHGQMEKGKLEKVMLRFMHGEVNVLVCTTIIESGLDIPNANTILINRADRFGLAQLYQLRGRVGRSSQRAWCYLLIPAPKNLSGDAAQRIAALQRFTELGSGFNIASYDLDIRGAGDLLGANQAGHIDSVGYDAYMSMLRDAVDELQAEAAGEEHRPTVDPELKVAIEGRIPEAWLPETTLRLRLYKDLASAETVTALYEAFRVAVDRFGKAPPSVDNLVELMAIKLEARTLGLTSVGYNASLLTLGLSESGTFDGDVALAFLQRRGNLYRLTSDHALVRPVSDEEWSRGLETLRDSLREITNFASSTRRSRLH